MRTRISLLLRAAVLLGLTVLPAATPRSEAYLGPIECDVAEQFDWEHPAWNWFCRTAIETWYEWRLDEDWGDDPWRD